MSAMRSASSITTRPTLDRSATLRSIRSMRRRGRHHDLGAGLQRGDLLAHLGAAVDGDEPQVAASTRGRLPAGDPPAQLAVGTSTRPVGRFGDAAGTRSTRGRLNAGLARAGLGLAAHVAAGQGVGDAEALDGEKPSSGPHGRVRPPDQRTRSAQRTSLVHRWHGSGRAYRPVRSRPIRDRAEPRWSAGGHVVATLARVHHVDQAGEAADGVLAEPAMGQFLARCRNSDAVTSSWWGSASSHRRAARLTGRPM